MSAKTEQFQMRVSPFEKATIKRLAEAARMDVSSYVISRVISPAHRRVGALMQDLRVKQDDRYALAELNDVLTGTSADDFSTVVADIDVRRLTPFRQNYVAAMVEQAAAIKNAPSPAWTRKVVPLDAPWFASSLKSVRDYLIRTSPTAFKERNLFVDASIGARV